MKKADTAETVFRKRKISIRRYLNHSIIWRKMAKQILKIILSLGAAALSLLCGLNAEKLFVKNLGLVTIPVPNREIEPYTVITEDMAIAQDTDIIVIITIIRQVAMAMDLAMAMVNVIKKRKMKLFILEI